MDAHPMSDPREAHKKAMRDHLAYGVGYTIHHADGTTTYEPQTHAPTRINPAWGIDREPFTQQGADVELRVLFKGGPKDGQHGTLPRYSGERWVHVPTPNPNPKERMAKYRLQHLGDNQAYALYECEHVNVDDQPTGAFCADCGELLMDDLDRIHFDDDE